MIALPRVAARIFDTPLAIAQSKLDVIVGAIGPRLLGQPLAEFPDDGGDSDQQGYQVQDGIALIDISGTLVCKATALDAISGLTSYQSIGMNFNKAMADPMVSGILLAFDSPGGEVKGLFDLADSMSAEPRNKPMLAFVDQACSAAFMLASTADQIVISQVGEIGSVGVIALHRDVSARDEQDGLKYTAIYAGARKNDGNPHEPLTPGAKSEIQSRIDQIYEMFATAVAQNRGMSAAAVRKTEAAIFLGESGVEIGLADAVGSMDDAVGMLASAIQKGERSLFASSAGAPANSTKEKHMEATSGAPAETKQPTAAEIEALVKQARDAGFAEASGIADLCAIAGTPARAAEFIGQRKSVDQVRKELLAARVEAEAGKELNSGVMPGAADAAAAAASGPVQGKAKPWREVLKGLGARLKGEV